VGEKSVEAVLIAPAQYRKIHTTMKQQRNKDAKTIRIDRTGLSVCSHAPKLQRVIIYYEDVEAEQPQLHQRQRSVHPQREFIWISPRISREKN
jgi:GTP cyclohydrolase FolE2